MTENPPSFRQQLYAVSLVDRMRERHLLGADVYADRVEGCDDKKAMSKLIDEMKGVLEDSYKQ